jgi:hypothetical protein
MPELSESIEYINKRLIQDFGREWNGMPRWRVVFSDDQLEKRWTEFTDEGFQLINPEVRELPKYRQRIQGKYILERLVPVVPPTDLVDKISYEPAWVFEDRVGNYLPPYYDGCKFVIESVYSAIDKKGNHVKYKDPANDPEYREKLIDDAEDKLFGNETELTDALHHKAAIINPLDSKTAGVLESLPANIALGDKLNGN